MKTLWIALLIFAAGCSQPVDKTTASINDTIDTMAADGTLIDTSLQVENSTKYTQETKTFKGLYTYGDETSLFRDCSGTKLYWVEDERHLLKEGYKKATDFLSYPFESVYVELSGRLKGRSDRGYAAEYENVLVVSEVKLISQKNYKAPCFNYEYIGLGNEPFWSLEILPQEKIISFKDVGVEKTYVFPYKPGTRSGSSISYESQNDLRQTISVQITKETCSDGMSNKSYNYSVLVSLSGKRFSGCAIKHGEDVSSNH